MEIKKFIEFVNENYHKVDGRGYIPAAWEGKFVQRNKDGKKGIITSPVVSAGGKAQKYRVQFEDGEVTYPVISSLWKDYTFVDETPIQSEF